MDRKLIATLVLFATSALAWGQFDLPSDLGAAAGPPMRVDAVVSHTRVQPGQTFHVALDVSIDDGWAWYSPHPGPYVLAGSVRAEAGPFEVGEVRWPRDRVYQTEGLDVTNYAYKGRTIVYVPLTVPAGAETGREELSFELGRQVCEAGGACIDLVDANAVTASAVVTVGAESVPNPAWDGEIAARLDEAMPAERLAGLREGGGGIVIGGIAGEFGWFAWMGLALLAGLALNIMPCVLPIIPLRIYSIVNMAKENPRRIVTLGLTFALGIAAFFLAIGGLNVALHLIRGQAYNWAEMWQLPAVRVAMILLLVAVAANLFGLFNVTVPKKVAEVEAKTSAASGQGHLSSLGMGFMMAVLSTPCSFGLLLAVLGWAQTQPLTISTAAFGMIGVGMALPHALLVVRPSLIQKLPKPGVWMEYFKQSMGFALLLVVAWLLDTFDTSGRVGWVVAYGVLLTMGLWIWGTWVKYSDSTGKKLAVRGAVAVALVATGWWMLTPEDDRGVEFEEFDRGRIATAREEGKPVVVKFTAGWCMECKVVQRNVYSKEEVAERLTSLDAVAFKADVTNRGVPADVYLKQQFPGKSPPLTVVFLPDAPEPYLLTGGFSKEDLYDVLARAGGEAGENPAPSQAAR